MRKKEFIKLIEDLPEDTKIGMMMATIKSDVKIDDIKTIITFDFINKEGCSSLIEAFHKEAKYIVD